MEERVVSGVAYSRDEAQITLLALKDQPGMVAKVTSAMAQPLKRTSALKRLSPMTMCRKFQSSASVCAAIPALHKQCSKLWLSAISTLKLLPRPRLRLVF